MLTFSTIIPLPPRSFVGTGPVKLTYRSLYPLKMRIVAIFVAKLVAMIAANPSALNVLSSPDKRVTANQVYIFLL